MCFLPCSFMGISEWQKSPAGRFIPMVPSFTSFVHVAGRDKGDIDCRKMPYVVKHRRPPEPWHEFKKNALHVYLLPLYWMNWIGEWIAYFLGKWSIFEVLEYAGSFSILFAAIFYFAGAGDRLKQKHYQAWQVINTAQGKGGSGGRIEALHELNEDRVPLVGVDVSDAYLQDVELIGADLRRADMRGTDLRRAVFRKANLEGANFHSANLRNTDFTSANLTDANLLDADLTQARLAQANLRGAILDRADLRNANLGDIRDWQSIHSIQLANVHGVISAPEGFLAWAKNNGAVDLADDAQWEKLLAAEATTKPVSRN